MIRPSAGALLLALLASAPASSQEAGAPPAGLVQPPAEPFGFQMGMPAARLRGLGAEQTRENPHFYELRRAPNPHPEFESYLLVVGPTQGLCKVIAVGRDIPSNVFGDAVRARFEQLKGSLQSKYGTPTDVFDYVRVGSLWEEPEDFMMSLVREDRRLVGYWEAESNPTVPPNLVSIWLEAKALTLQEGYLTLNYEFANLRECQAEIQRASSDPL